MKVKNIRQFRTYFREVVNDLPADSRDEHFVGQKHISEDGKKIYGFFHIYHGDKADIRQGNFLSSFLDMAKDAQAVYEFLQNAVDANSTAFCMLYDDDYLLVMNNGLPFSFEQVRSILNVGSTTKESESDIGRFGIGFKLVHRLIGESSGIEELTENYRGPIIFSWYKADQLKLLQNLTDPNEIEIVNQHYQFDNSETSGKEAHLCLDQDPWLFKILITNFPTQPFETVYDLNYCQRDDLFDADEIREMSSWLTKAVSTIDLAKYDTGSLFFLKLGKNKRSHLDTPNLENGVRFSLDILNNISRAEGKLDLETVNINGRVIKPSGVEFERFKIAFDSDNYKAISPRRRNPNDKYDLEILFGFFRNYELSKKYIRRFPNFYLYFPLSEEVHNLNFILHSNGFYNESQRTNLVTGARNNSETFNSLNERLLNVFSKMLFERLDIYKQKNKERFLEIYATLLLCDKSSENHKQWVDEPLYDQILTYIRKNIPTQSSAEEWCFESQSVKIKSTSLPITPADFGIHNNYWFYWTEDTLVNEALKSVNENDDKPQSKLLIKEWSIIDLIGELTDKENIDSFNRWVHQICDTDIFPLLILEINQKLPHTPPKTLLDKLDKLKLFRFDEQLLSLNELGEEEHANKIFVFDKTEPIKAIIEKLGFVVSHHVFSGSSYSRIKRIILDHKFSYLTEDSDLFEILRSTSEACIEELDPSDKKQLLTVIIENFDDLSLDMLSEWRLFRDVSGKLKPLSKLLPYLPSSYPDWLHAFQISETEYFSELQSKYLVSSNEIFAQIIVTYWNEIITQVKGQKDIQVFYDQIINFYNESSENGFTLSERPYLFIDSDHGFVERRQVFYNQGLKAQGISSYERLQTNLLVLFGKRVPHQSILPFLETRPFETIPDESIPENQDNHLEVNKQDLIDLLTFCQKG